MISDKRIQSILYMLAKEPNDVFLNYALGLEYVMQKSTFDLAEAQFIKVKQLNPQYIAAYFQLGQLYVAMQKKEAALLTFNQGLALAKDLKNNKAVNEISEAIFLLED